MQRFEIANLLIDFGDNTELFFNMEKFKSERVGQADLSIMPLAVDKIDYPDGDKVAEEQLVWLYKRPREEGHYVYLPMGNESSDIGCLLDIDSKWQAAKISFLKSNTLNMNEESFKYGISYLIHMLIGVAFRNRLLYHNGIVMHASSIKWRGKGILFSAPSGTGKSTHVRLWQKHMGDEVEVLNDDTPAVRFLDGIPYVFGTPWGGSTNVFRNDSAPAEAIVVLQQAPENRIRRLDLLESLSLLAPRFFLPYADKDMMATALGIIDQILSAVPVYLLECKPDQEAVELVYNCVK